MDPMDPDPEHCLFVTELVDSGPSTELDMEIQLSKRLGDQIAYISVGKATYKCMML